MSVLQLPRIHFAGFTDWNPCTVNNLLARGYDKDCVALTSEIKDRTDYEAWLINYNGKGSGPNGGWNVYGDHGAWFREATISAVDLGDGPDTSDHLVGKTISMIGDLDGNTLPRLVDVDPSGGDTTSQIFLQGFRIGDGSCGVTIAAASRLYCRWPGRQRNLQKRHEGISILEQTGVIWQTAGSPVRWTNPEKSDALAALQKEAEKNAGLMLRFASYATIYHQVARYEQWDPIGDGKSLVEAYRAGFRGGNPARSALAGTLGVWQGDELMTAPSDRMLRPSGQVPGRDNLFLGPASARVDAGRKVVAVDFLATFPEENADLVKANLGTFRLKARYQAEEPITIGEPLTYDRYDKASYELSAGTCEFKIGDAQLETVRNGTLSLVAEGHETSPVLAEANVVVETDNRGLYLENEEKRTIQLRAYRNGEPAEGITIAVAQYYGEPNDDLEYVWHFAAERQNQHVELPEPEITTGRGGYATLPVVATKPGNSVIVFYPGGLPPDYTEDIRMVARSSAFYACLRVFPRIPKEDPVWEKYATGTLDWNDIYQHVLQVFDFVYPIMSIQRDLSREDRWEGLWPIMEERTDLGAFEEAMYMPITRDLSGDRRKLLQGFFAQKR